MTGARLPEALYAAAALAFQLVLVLHFALRRWRYLVAIRWGWVVYALAIPFAALSGYLLAAGAPWWMWTGGFLYLAWAAFGFVVEYVRRIEWRTPILWPVFVPYIVLYLATAMFFWWPLARIGWAYWLAATLLFIVGTILNVTSHRDRSVSGARER